MLSRTVYSFIIDGAPIFAYQGYILAKSIIAHCHANPGDIYIHFSSGVSEDVRAIFRDIGVNILCFEPFGDRKYCNKIVQLPALAKLDFGKLILLDTDTIVVEDLASQFDDSAILGKIVDCCNPSIQCLEAIFDDAGIDAPSILLTDTEDGATFLGNFNGGLYVVPKRFAPLLGEAWRAWAEFLLSDNKRLEAEGKTNHVDQVSFAMACSSINAPVKAISSNFNFFTHFEAQRHYYNPQLPVFMLHYHNNGLDHNGFIKFSHVRHHAGLYGIEKANDFIARLSNRSPLLRCLSN